MVSNFNREHNQLGREHIRQYPEMYIGGTDQDALHQLAFEVINHSINGALSSNCNEITIRLRDNHEICVHDNGEGIYTDPQGDDGQSFLEIFMTDIGFHLNRKDKKILDYKVEGGLHGVGLATINPLCETMRVESMYRNVMYTQSYQAGIPIDEVSAVRRLEKSESSGTVVTFRPDFSIFEQHDFDYDVLANRAYEVTTLVPGLKIHLIDERTEQARKKTFQQEDGLGEFLERFNQTQDAIHEPLLTRYVMQTTNHANLDLQIYVDVALQYIQGGETEAHTYVNTVFATGGGIHQRAVYSALSDRLNEIIRENRLLPADEPDFSRREITSGLTMLINIKHPEPEFRGMSHEYLCNPEIYGAVAGAVYQMEIPNDILQKILERCLQNRA